jgi:hypothetical protein
MHLGIGIHTHTGYGLLIRFEPGGEIWRFGL